MLNFNRRSFLSLFILLAMAFGTALPMGRHAAAQTAATDGTLGIAAVVNDDVISMLDLETRVNLVVATSNMPDSEETRARIRPQILRGLIDEKLMLQEAKRAGINVTQPEIEQGMANIAQANGTGVNEFKQLLASWGVPVAAMSARVEADIAWQTYIRKTLARTIKVGEEEVTDEIQRIQANAGRPEYLLAEIVLPVDNPGKDTEVRQLAARLLQQMQNGAPFSALAQNFSAAPSAAVGGDLGWVQGAHLEDKILNAVRRLQPGQVTPPIRTLGGYSMVLLRDQRTSPGLGRGESTLTLSQLHLQAPKDAGEQALNGLAARLQDMTRGVNSCARLDAVGEQQGSMLSGSLGQVKQANLPPAMQDVLASLPVGQPSKPIATGGGLAVLMVCDPQTAELDMDAVRERIGQQLLNERLNVAAQRRLRDLRRAAFVEIRL